MCVKTKGWECALRGALKALTRVMFKWFKSNYGQTKQTTSNSRNFDYLPALSCFMVYGNNASK